MLSFLGLPLTLYGIWVIYPTLKTIYLSFTHWNGLTPHPKWIGVHNYVLLSQDSAFWHSLLHNFAWLLVFLAIPTTIGFLLALALNTDLRLKGVLRAVFFFPMALAFVIIAVIWSWIYDPQEGLVNGVFAGIGHILAALGISANLKSIGNTAWLGTPSLVMWATMVPAVWRESGYLMLMFLAGLQSLDPEVLAAASVDGASGWKMIRHITLPLMSPIITVVVVIAVIDSLRMFDVINIMTKGGPGHSSDVLANYMYFESFNANQLGYGSAIAVILFLLSVIFIGFYLQNVVDEEMQ